MGNNEFSLASGAQENVISAAVADRALYVQTLDYADVIDDDLELFIEAQCDCEPSAVAALVRAFRGPRVPRSFRRLSDLIEDLQDEAGSAPIRSDDVRRHLSIGDAARV